MSWPTRCLPWTTRRDDPQEMAFMSQAPCSGGYCAACEGCDIHCDCANTEEVRHIAGANLQEIP